MVRGCDGSCAVATSTDGRAFTPVGSINTDDAVLHLNGRPIRAVRVALGMAGLRGVSVWEPRTSRPALRPVSPSALQDLRLPYSPAGRGGRSHQLLALLAGLLVLVIAFQIGRRGRSQLQRRKT